MHETIRPTLTAIMAVALTAPVHPLTGADVDAMAPLVTRYLALSATPTPGQMVAALPEAITVLAQLLEIDRAALASLQIHQIIEIYESALPRWMALNADYITAQLTPAVICATAALQGVIEAATTPQPNP
jgi:hypothetical protein